MRIVVFVSDCPINVRIYPSSTREAFEVLNCTADSYPEPFIYVWIDHANNDQITYGQTFSLQPGNYSLTCMAFTNITCHPQNRMCQDVGSYLAKNLNDTDSVFSTLFNAATPNYGYSEICNGSASISGYAVCELIYSIVLRSFEIVAIRWYCDFC